MNATLPMTSQLIEPEFAIAEPAQPPRDYVNWVSARTSWLLRSRLITADELGRVVDACLASCEATGERVDYVFTEPCDLAGAEAFVQRFAEWVTPGDCFLLDVTALGDQWPFELEAVYLDHGATVRVLVQADEEPIEEGGRVLVMYRTRKWMGSNER